VPTDGGSTSSIISDPSMAASGLAGSEASTRHLVLAHRLDPAGDAVAEVRE
jgi:hypothetical protein